MFAVQAIQIILCELELRQIYEAEDFGDAFTPELQEQNERIWALAEKNG